MEKTPLSKGQKFAAAVVIGAVLLVFVSLCVRVAAFILGVGW